MIFFEDLVETSAKVSKTASKKEKIYLLAEFLKKSQGQEIELGASFLSGQMPQGRLGIGWALLQKALENPNQVPRPVTLLEVNRSLDRLFQSRGPGSTENKVKVLHDLLSSTGQKEGNFLTGLLMGEIRQGALAGLLVEAIAQASGLALNSIQRALMFSKSIGKVARAALEEGINGLSRFQVELFQPVSPMLANMAENEKEALARWEQVACEFKIDGARIQIHKDGEDIRVYTRHLKEVTERVPEIVTLARGFSFHKAILEGEVFSVGEGGRPRSFQTTMRRFGRIRDVERMQEEIPLSSYFFDLLYQDGDPLFDRPYRERFAILSEGLPSANRIPQITASDEQAIQDFLRKSLKAGHEGIMAKGLDSPYVAGQRGFYWLKLKPAKTLDLVILAAEWGHGRRSGWLSNLHLGARDALSGNFVMLGKTFKGLTDKMLRWQTEQLLALETHRDHWTVYVKPQLMVEIAYNDLQESPRYPGGLALRFARVRRYREDKTPAEADTIQTIQTLFEAGRG